MLGQIKEEEREPGHEAELHLPPAGVPQLAAPGEQRTEKLSDILLNEKIPLDVVNGQTGEVQGESPKSGWKIFFLVCGILIAVFVFLAIFGGGKHR